MLSIFALSRRVLARLRQAKEGVRVVENALRAFSTTRTKPGERRRLEQAIMTEVGQTPRKSRDRES